MTKTASHTLELKLDHVTICGSSLARLQQSFADIGLSADYGGTHTDSSTQMGYVGFEDGSYLELIAPMEPGAPVRGRSKWSVPMAGDAGPCAWAARVDDIGKEIERLSRLGIPTSDLTPGGRRKPDGTFVRWVAADVGHGQRGAVLPFLIQDRSPRSCRVQPSARIRDSSLVGVEMVVLGVNELGSSIELFRKAYSWGPPLCMEDPHFGANLAHFRGTPVTLAGSLNSASWLTDRLERFDELPAAFLIGAREFDRVSKRHSFLSSKQWFEQRVGWIDASRLCGIRLGIIEHSSLP
jgi:hypothetical protein